MITLTNRKNGTTITSNLTNAAALEICGNSNNSFGRDLARSARNSRYGLSDAQWFWVHKIAIELGAPAASAPAARRGPSPALRAIQRRQQRRELHVGGHRRGLHLKLHPGQLPHQRHGGADRGMRHVHYRRRPSVQRPDGLCGWRQQLHHLVGIAVRVAAWSR